MASWHISGEIIDSCQCLVFCNNILLREPFLPVSGQALQLPPVKRGEENASDSPIPVVRENASGKCSSVTAWIITEGAYGDTRLDGLCVVALVQSPGPLFNSGGWKRALYIDESGSEDAQKALTAIFDGDAGGYFKRWKDLTAIHQGVKVLPIRHESAGERRHVTIPDIMDLTTEPILGGRDRQPVQLVNPPFWKAPGNNPTIGRSVMFRFDDHGQAWQLSGRSSCYSPFAYSGDGPDLK